MIGYQQDVRDWDSPIPRTAPESAKSRIGLMPSLSKEEKTLMAGLARFHARFPKKSFGILIRPEKSGLLLRI